MKQVIVLGLGRFGTSLATTLYKLGYEVMAIDQDPEKVQGIANFVTQAVQADAMDEEALKSVGVKNFDVAIVAIGQDDIEANILVTVMLKELGLKYVISRAETELHGKVLYRVGADKVIFPERDMGIRLAHSLISNNVLDYLELSPEYRIAEVITPEFFIGKSLEQLQLRAKYNIIILAIKRAESEKVVLIPGKDTMIYQGDILVAVGKDDDLIKLQQ